MRETFEQMVARINASAFIPPKDPTGACKVAKPIKLKKGQEFKFKAAVGGGGDSRYPWDEWLNGDLLLLEQSVGEKDEKGKVINITEKRDFEVDAQAMRGKVKLAGRKRYKYVDVSYRDADGTKLVDSLIIRARDMTDDERVAEDLLRAEEKEALKERREQEKLKAATNDTPTD